MDNTSVRLYLENHIPKLGNDVIIQRIDLRIIKINKQVPVSTRNHYQFSVCSSNNWVFVMFPEVAS